MVLVIASRLSLFLLFTMVYLCFDQEQRVAAVNFATADQGPVGGIRPVGSLQPPVLQTLLDIGQQRQRPARFVKSHLGRVRETVWLPVVLRGYVSKRRDQIFS